MRTSHKKMKRIFQPVVLLAALAIAAAGARAQTIVTVTGTITDSNNVPYSNGQVTININPPGVTSPFITATGAPILFPILTSTNSIGFFTVQLLTNASITPGGTQYTFRICTPVVPPPVGTGNSCFTPAPVTISANVDLSTTFNPVAPKLTNLGNIVFSGPQSNLILTGAGSNNTVDLLNFQGPAAAITGTGAAATYYTFTLGANVLAANKCLLITSATQHTTGTTSAQMTLSFGGTSTTNMGDDATSAVFPTISVYQICNNGSTSSQSIVSVQYRGNAGTTFARLDTAAIATTSAVTINLQFNVAATDAVKPGILTAKLLQ